MIKKFLFISISMLVAAVSLYAQAPDYSRLTTRNHPRLFITDADLKMMRRQIANGTNPYLDAMHVQMMKVADTKGVSADSLKYNPKTAKNTLLGTMRLGLTRSIAGYVFSLKAGQKVEIGIIASLVK